MPDFIKGQEVYDFPTGTVRKVLSRTCRQDDGPETPWAVYVLLDVPQALLTPDYPNGWRHAKEVSKSRKLINSR